jgi:hypothetical protein
MEYLTSTEATKPPRALTVISKRAGDAPPLVYFPNHATIRRLNEACERGDIDCVKTLIAKWAADPDPPSGPPGYETYALEPVFYHAIEEGQGAIVSYFLDHGIRMCKLAIHRAIECQVSTTVLQAFLDHGWDINDTTPGTAMFGLIAHPLGLVI